MKNNMIRQLREAQMLTKAELARKANLSPLTIHRIEKDRPSRRETQRKILYALGAKVSDWPKVFGG